MATACRSEINVLVALLKAADEITRCAMLPATTNLLLARSNLTDWELEIQKVRLRAYRLDSTRIDSNGLN